MAHRIVELAPVGSQWKCHQGGTFFNGRVLTIVRHDMNERRVRYVYGNDTQEMSKSFDTFERECKQGNITRVGEAAPKATVALCTGDVIKTADRNCSPFSGGSELTILEIDSVHERVKYKYKNGSTCTKDLWQFHDFLRRGLMTVIGRASKEPLCSYKIGDLFDVCMEHDRQYIEGRILRIEKIENGVVSYNYVRSPMPGPSRVLLQQFITDNDTGVLTLRKPHPEEVPVRVKSPFEARALAMDIDTASGEYLGLLGRLASAGKYQPAKGEPVIQPEIKPEVKSEEKPMTRIVNVFLMDTTPGLKASERLIGKVENFATDSRNDTTLLLEMSMEHNLAEMLKAHNLKRKAIINQDILNRVGKTVYLQPIEMSDVKIDITLVTSL